jgi:hypothetical protein
VTRRPAAYRGEPWLVSVTVPAGSKCQVVAAYAMTRARAFSVARLAEVFV